MGTSSIATTYSQRYYNKFKRASTYKDPHHPSLELQEYYYNKQRNNPAWRPTCLDCNTARTMIKCKNSFYCAVCNTERKHDMVLITKGSKISP